MTNEEKKILKNFLAALKNVKECTDSTRPGHVNFGCFGAFNHRSQSCQEYASDGAKGKVICRLCRAMYYKQSASWIPDFIELELG